MSYAQVYRAAVAESVAEQLRIARREWDEAFEESEKIAARLCARGYAATAVRNGTTRCVQLDTPRSAREAALLTGGEAYQSQVYYL